jgi:hypothetical protein
MIAKDRRERTRARMRRFLEHADLYRLEREANDLLIAATDRAINDRFATAPMYLPDRIDMSRITHKPFRIYAIPGVG